MASCELCRNFGPAELKYSPDLAREHAKAHFHQLRIIDDQISPDHIYEKCFPIHQRETAGRRKCRKTLSRKILLDLCQSLFPPERRSVSQVTCAKCGVAFKLLKPKGALNSTAIIDHACSHLEQELYACRHCSRQFNTDGAVRAHLVKVHRINSIDGHFENKCHKFVKEISLQIKSCFGPDNKKGDSDEKWARTSLRIRGRHEGSDLALKRLMLCHQLITKVADKNKIVKCRLCSSRLSVKKRQGGFYIHQAMFHALMHLQKPTERCRICSKAFTGRGKLQHHMRNVHALPLANNYDCLTDEHHAEIMTLIESCYGEGNATGNTIAPRSVNRVRQHTKGSELAIQRKLLCLRLVGKFGDREKQLKCRLCSKWINAKDVTGALRTLDIMRHALLHLAKSLFRCKQCSANFTNSGAMATHLKVKHSLPLDKNHECSQDEHHSEILGILRECYGDERVEVKME